jgi:hypothetical protein
MDGNRRHSFTLIELFVSLGLLTLCGSLTCVQGLKALGEFRYKQSVKKLQEEITFANHLSLSSTSDIHLLLYWEKGVLVGSYFSDDSDFPIDPILRGKRSFEKIDGIKINGEILKDPYILTFSPTLRVGIQDIEIEVESRGSEPVYIKGIS